MNYRLYLVVFISAFFFLKTQSQTKEELVFSEEFAQNLIKTLSLEQKVSLLSGMGLTRSEFGDKNVPVFGIKGIPDKSIPDFIMGHGITGVRSGRDSKKKSTYFGTPIAYASTWNLDLYKKVGVAIAKEMRALGQDLNLGPTVNIIRHPLGGRNWECLSEDPYINTKFIVPYVKAMQNNGIVLCPKHYVVNNQEKNRFDINNEVDERTLHEIYLPGFKAAVIEGKALSIMGSYNRLNGEFMCQNDYMLNTILRDEWGFEGFVLSDFGNGLRDTKKGINGGLNLEMASPKFYGDALLKTVNNGEVSVDKIDEMLLDVIKTMHVIGVFDRPRAENKDIVHCDENIELAKKVAVESSVLLKNEKQLLPINKEHIKSIAVIGPNAVRPKTMRNSPYYLQGGGSGRTYYFKEAIIDPLTGIKSIVDTTLIKYAQGCKTPNTYRLKKNLNPIANDDGLIEDAVQKAKNSEYAIIFAGLTGANESEGRDRVNCLLPGDQNELIKQVAAVNKNTIVVLISGSYIDVSYWIDDVSTLLFVPYSGEQIGNGIADVLTGEVSPSGKLTFSWPKTDADYPKGSIFKGKGYSVEGKSNLYSEGVFVGYRWFDKQQIEVQFPFGYGLSYSKFNYSNLNIKSKTLPIKISVDIENTGHLDASEIVQVYINDKVSTLDKPVNELRGFQKTFLKPGEKKTLIFELGEDAFSNYNVDKKTWEIESGEFIISVGKHSRSLQLSKEIEL